MLRRFFPLVFVILILSASQACGTMRGLSTAALTVNSDVVVRGDVESVEPFWGKDGKAIMTRATVLVSTIVKGVVLERRVVVEYEGGEIDGLVFYVSDVSPMKPGENVVLFLKRNQVIMNGATYSIVGQAQGKYTVDKEGIARKGGFSAVSEADLIDNNLNVDKLFLQIEKAK